MIYRFSKIFSAVSIGILSVFMAAVFVFYQLLPDRIYLNSDNSQNLIPSYGNFLSFEKENNQAKTVFSPNEKSHYVTAKLMGIFPVKPVSVTVTDEKIVTVCGSPFGVKMFTDGVMVVGFSRIETTDGVCCPAADSGFLKGDVIKSVNGQKVSSNEEVASHIENSGGKSIDFLIDRNKSEITVSLSPKMLNDKSGYKVGFWVRDSSAGIGTLTFYDPETMDFAGLGHAVCDVDTGAVLPLSSGEIVPAAITSIDKGIIGDPGELGGTFITMDTLGTVTINNETGLYGKLEYEIEGFSAPIGHKQDIYEGPAVILSTIDGTEVNEYDIVIDKVDLSDDSPTQNMIIKVVDEELIELTGGIVQGMSGSPILQDGKLIGAVTHVFINDPTKGYGIFIENMLEAAG